MEEVVQDQTIDVKPRVSRRKYVRNGCILLFAVALGYLHYRYVSTLHENYYHFSHLSDLERELTLRTEMGFYYSYYKTVVEERPFLSAMTRLMYDRLVEYPEEVNAFNRFNIHPEVIIGALYRYAEPVLNTSNHKECHLVHRGEGLPPVQSCGGLGVPMMFYLEAVWILAGLLVTVVFLQGATLSGTVLGGVLSAAQYLANHGQATRVQRSPNERENLAVPLLCLQVWLLTVQLRYKEKKTCFQLQVSIFIVNCLCLLFWQLSQFIFLTQTAIFFLMEQLKIIELKTLCVFLHSHFCGLHMAVLLLQGNDMLKSSLYTSFFIAVSVYSLFFATFRIKVKTKFDFAVEAWLVILRISIVVCLSFYLKKLISDFIGAEEDNHIWELLFSKFTDYKSFHTLMYTCIDVFDFLPRSYFIDVSRTILLPLTIYSSLYYCLKWLSKANVETTEYFHDKNKIDLENYTKSKSTKKKDKNNKIENKDTDSDDSGIENNTEEKNKPMRLDLNELSKEFKAHEEAKERIDSVFIYFMKSLQIDPAIFYNVAQMIVFGIMAYLFMRLKILLTTQMCVVASLAVNANMAFSYQPRLAKLIFWGLAVSVIAQELYGSITRELAIQGEFSDYETEELIEWITRETPASAAFAASMPVSAAVMLSARRAVVSHPHYEHADARDRAYAVHKMYGRFTAQQLYEELTKLKATYLIVENRLCYGRTTQGCTILDIWDAEKPFNKSKPQLCHTILTETTEHLYRVFANKHYQVFRVHDLSVRYMPRVFDT